MNCDSTQHPCNHNSIRAIIRTNKRTGVLEKGGDMMQAVQKVVEDPDEREIEELSYLLLKIISETEDQ